MGGLIVVTAGIEDQPSAIVPLVALGASAGGLEPLEAFFESVPNDSNWCFVVIQHLSTERRSMMDEILARRTRLAIRHVAEGVRVEPGTIFLNLPNTIVTLEEDRFVLRPFEDTDPIPHLPIDAFFSSLVNRDGAITAAVVLSGSGLDGAAGATALRRAGGRVFVQSPTEAKFDSMPRAAIVAGAANRVLGAATLAGAIEEVFADPDRAEEGSPRLPELASEAILRALEEAYGVDFAAYKRPTVMRRIERRHQLRGLSSVEAYRDLVVSDPEALDELYHDLLIGVTEFYRDPEAFASLRRHALSALLQTMQSDLREIRIWVLACAGGEEAYTIAIELSEVFREAGLQPNFRIIATDVHRPSIERAAASQYSEAALHKLPRELRERYFIRHRHGWLVDPYLRRRVIFSVHDALRDPPFMQLDLISCRNFLIYLKDAAQERIFSKFVFSLRKGGYLLLGPSESIRPNLEDFAAVDTKWRVYRKETDRRVLERSMLMEAFHVGETPRPIGQKPELPARPPLSMVEQNHAATRPDRDSLLRGYDALLRRFAPSSILITSDGAVLTWFGTAGAYIDTMSDLAEWTVDEIVHPDLRYAISIGIERIVREGDTAFNRRVALEESEGEGHMVRLGMVPLSGNAGGRRFLLVTLERTATTEASDAGAAPEVADATSSEPDAITGDKRLLLRRIHELERDLRLTEESLQYVTERLEASGEELQASNQELQASNEELQASNEELQASNEELHAVNEELVSVSAEHERKIELLSELNHDTELVFENLGVGLVILDETLRIRRFTASSGDALELEPQDVGRPIANVGARPDFADPADLARNAVKTGRETSATGPFRNGELNIQAIPFKGEARGRSGVILLFTGTTLDTAASVLHAGGEE